MLIHIIEKTKTGPDTKRSPNNKQSCVHDDKRVKNEATQKEVYITERRTTECIASTRMACGVRNNKCSAQKGRHHGWNACVIVLIRAYEWNRHNTKSIANVMRGG